MPSITKNTSKKKTWLSGATRIIRHYPLRTRAVGAVALVVLAGGVVAATPSSKPGDPLYNVELTMEQLRLSLSFSDEAKEGTHLDIAKQRLQEIQALFAEKDINAPGVAEALANFEKHRQAAVDLATGTPRQKEVEDELVSEESEIDKLFESRQISLENVRESLKKQAEAAERAGDTARASQLRAQANALEAQLKILETKREASKKEQEKLGETIKAEVEPEDANKETESQQEVINAQQQALTHAVEQELEAQHEAAKQMQEQEREAAQKAQEQQDEEQKQQQEKEQEHSGSN